MKCPGCSADVAANAVKCGNCDTPVPTATAAPKSTGERGWGTEVKSFECDGCGAQMVFKPSQMTLKCAYCGNEKVTEQPAAAGNGADSKLVRPEFVVPFKVAKEKSGELFQQWVTSLWFAPGDLSAMASAGPMRGVYLPFWSFDVETNSWYEAEVGRDRKEEHSVTKTVNGQSVQVMETKTVTDWSRTHGWNRSTYDDVLVCASKGVDRATVVAIEPFDMKERTPYTPEILAGWEAERYSIDEDQSWKQFGKARVDEMEKAACEKQIRHRDHPDRIRGLSVDTRFNSLRSRHVLLPLYVSGYTYGGKIYKFMINGQTGEVQGQRPYSTGKIVATVLVALLLVIVPIALLSLRKHPDRKDLPAEGPSTPTSPALGIAADTWTSPALARSLSIGQQVTGYARKLTQAEIPTRETSDVGSWYKVSVPTNDFTVQLIHAVAREQTFIDFELRDESGKTTIARGLSNGGVANLQLSRPPGTIYVRVYYYTGTQDLFQYRLQVVSGRRPPLPAPKVR